MITASQRIVERRPPRSWSHAESAVDGIDAKIDARIAATAVTDQPAAKGLGPTNEVRGP